MNVALPAELVSVAKLEQGDAFLGVAKIIALELFREGVVSPGRAAELCGSPLAAFMDFAAARGVPPLNYDLDELEKHRRTLSQLNACQLFPIPRRAFKVLR